MTLTIPSAGLEACAGRVRLRERDEARALIQHLMTEREATNWSLDAR